ncbi:MAG: tetratricopeptide repeat protein [Treponema sp.]|nr:tetratricopeptide repeat protein [Treponema sp.]
MKTISFYSYKGGVGRSLALAYIAKELARFHLGICVLDIDLEAPGIIYKFEEEPDPQKYGVVDYIYACIIENKPPEKIEEAFFSTVYQASDYGYVKVMNAGRGIDTIEYWDKLSQIDWNDLFFGSNNEGLFLFENLKGMIKKQMNPDYLLIDSRSGVTIMSKVCNSVLPDTVLMFLVKNNENFNGSRMMYHHIANSAEYKVNQKNTDIICAITRIPEYDPEKDAAITGELVKKIGSPVLRQEDVFIVHSDRDVEYEELFIIQKKQDGKRQIVGDYLKIVDKIVDRDLVKKRSVRKPKYRFIENDLKSLADAELKTLSGPYAEKSGDPRLYQAFFELALRERNDGSVIKAVAHLCEVIDNDKELRSKALYWRGIIFLYDFSNYTDAKSDLKMAHDLQGASRPRILYDLAACSFCLDKYDEALEYVGQYISAVDAPDFRGFLLRAFANDTKFEKNKKKLAPIEKNSIISDYDRAIELKPRFAGSYNNRGIFYTHIDENEKALADYNRAIETDAGYAAAYINRGNYYYKLKENEKALADYNRAVEIDADYTFAYNARGNFYYRLKENEKALADYNKAIETDPDYAVAYYDRGNVYYKLKENEKALADYDKAVEIDPDYAAAYINRGNVYYNLNGNEKALADYNRAIEIDANNANAYFNRGVLYYNLNGNEKALADYNRVIEIDVDYANAYNNRGVFYHNLNEYEKALADYNKALEINPNLKLARDNREKLYAKLGKPVPKLG